MNQGIYCLVFNLRQNMKVQIGKRKNKDVFPKGFYCYVGSGMNNLDARINRHLSKDKNKKWHIDYLLDHADMAGVKTILTRKKLECKTSDRVKELSDSEPAKGFGSSDCKCDAHLHYFKENPLGDERFLSIFEIQ
ncbi:MAG: GIY-YIG nuclease family protein [Nanoarchaeota archaeon]